MATVIRAFANPLLARVPTIAAFCLIPLVAAPIPLTRTGAQLSSALAISASAALAGCGLLVGVTVNVRRNEASGVESSGLPLLRAGQLFGAYLVTSIAIAVGGAALLGILVPTAATVSPTRPAAIAGVTGLFWFAILASSLFAVRRDQLARVAAATALAELAAARVSAQTAVDGLRVTLRELVTDNVGPALNTLQMQLRAIADQEAVTAAALRSAAESFRTVSRDVGQTLARQAVRANNSPQPRRACEPDPRPVRSKLAWQVVAAFAARRTLLGGVIAVLPMALPVSDFFSSAMASLGFLCLAAVTIASSIALAGWYGRFLGRSRVAGVLVVQFTIVAAAGALVAGEIIWLRPDPEVPVPKTTDVLLLVGVAALVSGAVLATCLVVAAQLAAKSALAQAVAALAAARWELEWVQARQAALSARFARFLHSDLQGDLLATSYGLLSSAEQIEADPTRRLSVKSTIEQAQIRLAALIESMPTAFERTSPPAGSSFELLAKVIQPWRDVVAIRLDTRVLSREDISAGAVDLVAEIVQEGIANAVKHGRARTIEVTLTEADAMITLVIRDDGAGLPLEFAPGLGHARLAAVCADWSIRPGDRGGTVLTCQLASASPLR